MGRGEYFNIEYELKADDTESNLIIVTRIRTRNGQPIAEYISTYPMPNLMRPGTERMTYPMPNLMRPGTERIP
jgi:hypothetical protein